MGSGEQTTTQTTTLPGMGADEQGARALLTKLGQSGMAQMGDMTDLANGRLTLSPQDEELIRRIQQLTMESARKEARSNYEDMASQVEGAALDAGLEGSSIEAVNRAVLGRQLQQTLDQSALQGQITSAQQLRQSAVENAGIKMNANQLLLQQILGGAQGVANLSLQERLAQASTTQKQKTPFNVGGALALGARVGLGLASGGTSEVARAGADAVDQGATDNANDNVWG